MNNVTTQDIINTVPRQPEQEVDHKLGQMRRIFNLLLEGRKRPTDFKQLFFHPTEHYLAMPEKLIFRRLHQMEKLGIIEKIIEDGHVFYDLPK